MTQASQSGNPDNEALTMESNGNPWPCAIMVLVVCLTFLGVCFAGVYMVINLPQ